MSNSFRDILQQAQQRQTEDNPVPPDEARTPNEASAPDASPRRGRPSGKRSHPEYVQITAYITRATHRGVKQALLNEATHSRPREFSEVVEETLQVWLASKQN